MNQPTTTTRAQLLAKKQELEDALQQEREDRISALRECIAELAEEDGVTFATFIQKELLDAPKKKSAASPRGENPDPKVYRNPFNHQETATAKGAKPQWYKDAIEAGYTKEQLTIAYQDKQTASSNGAGARA